MVTFVPEELSYETSNEKVDVEPLFPFGRPAVCGLEDGGDEAGARQNVILQLQVEAASVLGVHHQVGVVQVLLRAPFHSLQIIPKCLSLKQSTYELIVYSFATLHFKLT